MKSIIAQKIPPAGLSKRFNRANKFKITRIKDDFGFHVYVLENTARREKLISTVLFLIAFVAH